MVVSTLGSAAVQSVASSLRDGTVSLDSSAVGIGALEAVRAHEAETLARLLSSLRGSVGPMELSLALETADAFRCRENQNSSRVEVTWTGPESGGVRIRTHFDVIREMLSEMAQGGEALVVGYSLTASEDSAMGDVIQQLSAASRRVGQVVFILHRDDEERNLDELRNAWGAFDVKPHVYTWDPPSAFPYAKLHAKLLVVDRHQMLVTSANLTHHGLEGNLELGVRVRGPEARVVAARFDHLIAEGVLAPWSFDH